MKKYCMINQIIPEQLDNYIQAHMNPWGELLQCLKDAGTIEEYIYIFQNYAIVFIQVEDDIDVYMEKFARSETGRKWLKWMSSFIAASPFADEEGNPTGEGGELKKVFDLNQQLIGNFNQL